ncbi:MAG: hypothetical protein VZR64_07965 [Eubacterium sp.]|nr:hypothetical protein [Eubacterium sp.]
MKFIIYVENEETVEIQKVADVYKDISDPLLLVAKQPPRILSKDYVKEVEVVVASDDNNKEVRTSTSMDIQWFVQWNSVMKIHRFLDVPKDMTVKDALLRIISRTNADIIVSGTHDMEIDACDYYGAGGEFLVTQRLF